MRVAFAQDFRAIPAHLKRSFTYDQGKEMTEHLKFTQDTNIKVYFAHPRSPWERGTSENTNGLIRQFFPRGTDFARVTTVELKHTQDLLNKRPRQTLD